RYYTLWIVILLVTAGTLIACGSNLDVGDIRMQQDTISVGQEATFSVDVTGSDVKIKWTASSGDFKDTTKPAVIYKAPNISGPVTITVEVTSNGVTKTKSTSFQVSEGPTAS